MIWGDLQHLLHDLHLANAPTESGDSVGELRDPHGKIIDGFAILKADLRELLPQLLNVGLPHSLHTNPTGFDPLPGRLCSALCGERRQHL